MALLTRSLSSIPVLTVSQLHLKLRKSPQRCNLPRLSNNRRAICYSNTPQWESSPVTYAPEDEASLLTESTNIFESMASSSKPDEASLTKTEQHLDSPPMPFKHLKKSLWILGPALLLITGVVPTLWLPLSSIFLGPNMASLLSLTGLDCLFNLGASLFLLMADAIARLNNIPQGSRTKPPSGYRFWNILANVTGFIVPLVMFISSQKGFLEPQMPFISLAVVLGPYFLLLSVQMLTEWLTWHWESPVWLVTPVVYEAYRLLQLMRGLKLGAELGAASWMMHTVRGLVCGWVLVLGVQLMRVAWYAGFTAAVYRQPSDAPALG